MLKGEVGKRVRDLINQTCLQLDVQIVSGAVRPDHVHLLVSVPPYILNTGINLRKQDEGKSCQNEENVRI